MTFSGRLLAITETGSGTTSTTYGTSGYSGAVLVLQTDGNLVEYADTSIGVSGETIDVYENGTVIATATTGSDGAFSTTADLQDAGTIQAYFYTDKTTGYNAAVAEKTVTANELPATVTPGTSSPSQVWAGTTVSFTGKADVTSTDRTTTPINGGMVALTGLGQETTGIGGSYSYTTKAEGGLQRLQAELLPNSDVAGDAFWTYIYSPDASITTRFRTRITLFHIASQMEAHHYYHIVGARPD
jgi:hypothetical protein